MVHPTDPTKSSGTIKKFNDAKDVDSYIDTLCVSMTLLAHRQFRVDMTTKNFKEVNTLEVAAACDSRLKERAKIIRPRIQMVRA